MAINKNHEFADLNGVKCAIVEKNVSQERADFLRELLEFNRYIVVVESSAAPKAASVPVVNKKIEASTDTPPSPSVPASFTIGVTNVCFNAVNAVFGRSLKTRDGHVVTLAYWRQEETAAQDDVPYFEKKKF